MFNRTKTFVKSDFILVSVRVGTPQERHVLTHRRGQAGSRSVELSSPEFSELGDALAGFVRESLDNTTIYPGAIVQIGSCAFLLTRKEIEDMSSVTIEAFRFMRECAHQAFSGPERRYR
jgi:hypothetical protein